MLEQWDGPNGDYEVCEIHPHGAVGRLIDPRVGFGDDEEQALGASPPLFYELVSLFPFRPPWRRDYEKCGLGLSSSQD